MHALVDFRVINFLIVPLLTFNNACQSNFGLFFHVKTEISYHISWRRDNGGNFYCNSTTVANGNLLSGQGSLQCISGCSGTITQLSYICTDFSIQENWSFGERSVSFNFSSVTTTADEVTIGYTGCCWIPPFNSWSLVTRLHLTIRNNTGKINSTPRAITAPVVRLQEGCNHTIPLAVSDPDGDTVRCRWANGSECASVCNAFPGAVLNSTSCTITYWANMGTGYRAAAIVIEDFSPNYTEPLSSVGLQFLVLVVNSTNPCSQQPAFIPPTLPQGSCVAVPPMTTFKTQLRANSSSFVPITEIITASPQGTLKGDVQQVAGTSVYYVNITWTPTADQYHQTHLLCYTALNSNGLASEQICISLSTRSPPMVINGTNIPNQQLVHPSNTTWHARFDRAIQRPSMAAYITFHNSKTNEVVYQIDTSQSSEVSFLQSNEIFINPDYTFAEKQTFYIQLSSGAVQGVEGCGTGNEPIDNKTFWVFETMGRDITPPTITFTNFSVSTNGNISIAWRSNEEVVYDCKLVAGLVETVVNCSGAVWRGYNMPKDTYQLTIKATDIAGNEATFMYLFTVDLIPSTDTTTIPPTGILNTS